jgi:hypothetical protein
MLEEMVFMRASWADNPLALMRMEDKRSINGYLLGDGVFEQRQFFLEQVRGGVVEQLVFRQFGHLRLAVHRVAVLTDHVVDLVADIPLDFVDRAAGTEVGRVGADQGGTIQRQSIGERILEIQLLGLVAGSVGVRDVGGDHHLVFRAHIEGFRQRFQGAIKDFDAH